MTKHMTIRKPVFLFINGNSKKTIHAFEQEFEKIVYISACITRRLVPENSTDAFISVAKMIL